MGLEVRMEMFGARNAPQFSNPGATVSNMALNSSAPPQPERQIRLAAKFSF